MGDEDIFSRIKKYNFPVGEYVVVGGVLEARGIRKALDIDIVVSPIYFECLLKKGWKVCQCDSCKNATCKVLKEPGIDIYCDYSWKDVYKIDTEKLISTADMINGIPFINLRELLNWKRAARREKDLWDIELIEKYLQEPDKKLDKNFE